MSPHPDDVISALVKVAREEILTVFDLDSCIASTRIGIDVLTYFGIQAKPIPVSVTIFNEEARVILDTEGLDAVVRAVWERSPHEPGGPWTIGLGVQAAQKTPGPGHVAIAVPAKSTLIDLSLDQATRKRKDIILAPVALGIPDEISFFDQPGERMLYTVRLDDAPPVTLMYQHERQHLYRQSRNWHRKGAEGAAEAFKLVTASIIMRMKQELQQAGKHA